MFKALPMMSSMALATLGIVEFCTRVTVIVRKESSTKPQGFELNESSKSERMQLAESAMFVKKLRHGAEILDWGT
jgi:hypothetical protein